MNKPRFLIVTQYHLSTAVGGAEEQCWLLSNELVRRGWDVHYASEMQQAPEPGVVNGVTLHALPWRTSPLTTNRKAVHRLMQELRPDVVYNEVFDCYTRDAMLEAPQGTFRIWAAAAEGDGVPSKKLNLIRKDFGTLRTLMHLPRFVYPLWLARQGAHAADLVIAQHAEQQRHLREVGIESVIIHNPQTIPPESEMQSHDGRAMVLWVGRFKDWKRPGAFIELAKRCGDLEADFVMIGGIQEPKYKEILDNAAKALTNFRYDGLVSRERVGEYYGKAHVYVSTSQAEGYPNTFIHAMMHGVPILSMDVNPDGVLTDMGFGRLAHDVGGMEQAVRELLADPQKRRHIGARARKYAVGEFDLKLIVDRIEEEMAKRGVGMPKAEKLKD
jgi:glycosyltransferase involved in cell wall biosynthesis